jgi:anti-sigma regulatory factor (Ser/Thr protein kinase)
MVIKILQDDGMQTALPFTLPCDLGSAKQLPAIVEKALTLAQAQGISISSEFPAELNLALTEVFTNQVEHACAGRSGLITGQIEVGQENVTADLYDRGQPPSTPPRIPPLDLSNPLDRGYGLRLIDGLVDQYEYRQLEDGRNQWRLKKSWDG